jgi:uncharacterized protein (TIGR03435 family)
VAKPAFDVASLKPAPVQSGRITVDLGNSSHGRLTMTNVTLSECLRFAFNIYTDDQIVGPDWIKDHHILFDIVALAPPDIPQDRLRGMALTPLTERFQLVLRSETRERRYLALIVDKGGLKMHETKEDAPPGSEIVRSGRNRISPRLGEDVSRSIDAIHAAADPRYDEPEGRIRY